MFIHSAYYFEPQVLWEALRAKEVYDCLVVGHAFDDAYGGYHGECTWECDRERVRMTVKGNHEPYVHGHLPWVVGWRGKNGEKFETETLRSIGDFSFLWRVIAVTGPPPEPLTWGRVSAGGNLVGPVQFSESSKGVVADSARTAGYELDLERIHCVGPILYTDAIFGGSRISVTLPINLVGIGATFAVNRERDPSLLTEITYHLRRHAAGSRVPPSELPKVVAVAAALSLVVNIENEIDLLHTAHAQFSWAYRAHSTLLAFKELRVWRWTVLACVLLAISIGFAAATAVTPEDWRWVDVVIYLLLLVVLIMVVYAVSAASKAYRARSVQRWRAGFNEPVSPVTSLLSNNTGLSGAETHFPGTRHYRDPLDRDVLLGEYKLLHRPPRHEVEPTRMIVAGIIQDSNVPNVVAGTQEAEVCAVTNRILVPKENPDVMALATLADAIRFGPAFQGLKGPIDKSFGSFKTWLRGQKKPQAYKDDLMAAWIQYSGSVPTKVPTKGFLKYEKSASTVGLGGQKGTKTRLIQPPEARDKAILGHICSQMFWRTVKWWDGFNVPIVYGAGRTLEDVGRAVDHFLALVGGECNVVGYNVDMATYDACLGIEVQDVVFCHLYQELFGLDDNLIQWFTRVKTSGTTPHGVKYTPWRIYEVPRDGFEHRRLMTLYGKHGLKVETISEDPEAGTVTLKCEDFQMGSGRPDTNYMDTVVNAASFLGRVAQMYRVPYLLLVNGDDGFLLTLKDDATHVTSACTSFQLELGLKPEGRLCAGRWEWEFCSKLFWYGIHPKTRVTQTVLGAKPGRAIARIGVVTTLPGAMNIAAAALSVRMDAHHVPFISLWAERTYEICRDKRIRPKGAEYEGMHVSQPFLIDPKNYALAEMRYGVGLPHENSLRAILARVASIPVSVHWEPLASMCAVDEA